MLLSIPNSFAPNTTILSAAANANFSAVASVINGNLQQDNFGTFTGPLTWTISGNVLAVNIASASTTGVYVASLTGILASTKSAFDLESSVAQSTGRALAYLNLSNGASSIPALRLDNNGTGAGIQLNQSGSGDALQVNPTGSGTGVAINQTVGGVALEIATSTSAPAISVTDTGSGTAALDVQSTTRGALLPRMTYAQRNAIGTAVEGLEIYNTSSHCKQVYTGSAWVNIGAQCGDITPSAKSSPSVGYLACDGSAVSRTTYAELFGALSTSHGQGDGSTTFNLPDYRGRFLRMVDGSAGNDPDKSSRTAMATGGNTGNNVGSVQGNATKKNGLALSDPGHSHVEQTVASLSGGATSWPNVANTTVASNPTTTGGITTLSATTGISLGTGDNETRPINAYVNYFIKY